MTLRTVLAYMQEHRRGTALFDVNLGGVTPGDASSAAEMMASYAEAGLTWWTENIGPLHGLLEEMRLRIHQAPPKL